MKQILLILAALVSSSEALSSWSSYAYVSPKTEPEYKVNVYVSPTNNEKATYLVRVPAILYPNKQAWLIVTSKPLPPKEQNQRHRLWSEELDTKNIEYIVPIRPKEIPMFDFLQESNEE